MAKKTDTFRIDVPKGGAQIVTIDLLPALPSGGKAEVWKMDVKGEKGKVKDLVVGFDKKSNADDRRYEKAVLVFHLDAGDKKGQWRFIEEGVVYAPGKGDTLHDIETRVAQDGRELVLTIHNFDDSSEDVDFSFVAMYRDAKSGEAKIYTSADPGVRVGRPPGG